MLVAPSTRGLLLSEPAGCPLNPKKYCENAFCLLTCLLGVKLLEDVPEDQKDWHPNSGKQVLDLVHPSLFPVLYGITKSLRDGSPIAPPPRALEWAPSPWKGVRENVNLWSTQYQWLPSDFEIDAKGETTIKSYINNLHPVSHQKLYSTLEKIFSRFVPMFNIVTDELKRKVHELRRIDVELSDNPPKNAYHYPGRGSTVEWDFGWHMGSLSGSMFSEPQFTANINGKTVKVITKLASIHLTPKDPEFRGGSWHVEGMSVGFTPAQILPGICTDERADGRTNG